MNRTCHCGMVGADPVDYEAISWNADPILLSKSQELGLDTQKLINDWMTYNSSMTFDQYLDKAITSYQFTKTPIYERRVQQAPTPSSVVSPTVVSYAGMPSTSNWLLYGLVALGAILLIRRK